ncbi:MAG: hypothetical protein ABSH13_19810 [Candidatus Acidiferrum sp.]
MSRVVATTNAAATIGLLLLAFHANPACAQSEQDPVQDANPPTQVTSVVAPRSCPDQTSQPPATSQLVTPSSVLCGAAPRDPATSGLSAVATPASPDPIVSNDPPKRMFGMIPDFESANNTAASQQPLTVRQKYILAVHNSFDFSAYVGDAFQSAIQQVTNGQPHYGRGWSAYGERLAASEADQTSSSMLIYGVLPSVWHEDPRYFRQGSGSALSRIWYAVSRTFITRRDDGTNGFNKSQTVGQLVSCGISTSYYPAQDRSVGRVFLNWGVNLGYNSGYNVLTEYYTDMLNGIFHRQKGPMAASLETPSPVW